MNNNDFAQFIDELRESRNMTRNELVENIISKRQYYRFLKGESSLSNDVIDQMLNRLGISALDAYKYYFNEYNEINKLLLNSYDKIYIKDYKSAYDLLASINEDAIIGENQVQFYKIQNYILNHHINNVPYRNSAINILKLIRYPDILKNEFLTFSETAGLSFCFKYFLEEKDYRIAKAAYDLIIEKNNATNFISNNNKIPFFSATAQMLGYIKEYDKSIRIANKTISNIVSESYMSYLLTLHIINAMGAKAINNDDLLKSSLLNVFMTLRLLNNELLSTEYKKYIDQKFHIIESDLITYN